MTETDLKRAIIKAIKSIGGWAVRINVVGRRGGIGKTGERGMPDIWTPYGWIEVKLPGEKLSPDQVRWHARAEAHGVEAVRVDSVQTALSWYVGRKRKWQQRNQARNR